VIWTIGSKYLLRLDTRSQRNIVGHAASAASSTWEFWRDIATAFKPTAECYLSRYSPMTYRR
jgi:hypothetical protein